MALGRDKDGALTSDIANLAGVAASTDNVHAPASNTAAQLTFSATAGKSYVLQGVEWSYDADPTVDANGSFTQLISNKGYFSPNYANGVILLSFDTSGIPDAATVTRAVLKLWPTTLDHADAPSLQGEYYDWGVTIDGADWTTSPGTSAFSGVLLSGMTTGQYNSITLSGLTNISKTGTTRLRIGLDLVMSNTLGMNRVIAVPYDSNPAQAPILVVTYEQ